LVAEYQEKIVLPMGKKAFREYSKILFSCHSCGIEGSSFSVDDTRCLFEEQLGYHLDVELLKTINRLVTLRTLTYKLADAVPGEFTTVDMAAGDTVFGEHEGLVAQVPRLMSSTAEMMKRGELHPMILSARFHGFFEYLHPFRDGNGRTGRLLSNFILLRHDYPELIIQKEDRQEYMAALRTIRTKGTDEHLIAFFFKAATKQMENALAQKKQNSRTIVLYQIYFTSF